VIATPDGGHAPVRAFGDAQTELAKINRGGE
jgi:hypothetical protein